MEATVLIRTRSFWKALSRKVIYLIEDGSISWWWILDWSIRGTAR